MGWFGVGSASSRRTMVAVLVAGCAFTAVSVQAQDAPAAAPAQQPAPAQQAAPAAPPDPFKFSTDAAVMTFYVKPEQTQTFENIWGQIRGGLAASENPAHKSIANVMKVYRAAGDPTDNGVVYFIVVDPVDPNQSYSPSPFFLFEAGFFDDATARKLLADLQASLNGIVPVGVNNAAAPVTPPPPAPAAPAAPADGAAPATPPAQ